MLDFVNSFPLYQAYTLMFFHLFVQFMQIFEWGAIIHLIKVKGSLKVQVGSNLGPGTSCWKVGSYLPMPGGLQCSMHWFPPPVNYPSQYDPGCSTRRKTTNKSKSKGSLEEFQSIVCQVLTKVLINFVYGL